MLNNSSQVISVLLGTATGFFLPSLASFIRATVKGSRFENALEAEITEAKDSVRQKMLWVSRDHREFMAKTAKSLVVEFDNKLLYLGEDEDFSVSLPFWEHSMRDIVEVVPTRSFNRMCQDVILLRNFVSKFREMKLAFKIGGGDAKKMALACYQDLVELHKRLK